jgi:DNA repair protein RecN (Recombination protein N)
LLKQISITNFALFEQVNLDITDNFTVVTGETGAGKSLFIQSLQFLCGGKKPSTSAPDPDKPSSVGCIFSADIMAILSTIPETADIKPDQSKHGVELRRTILNGKTKTLLGNQSISQNSLKLLMARVMEVNAQHQHLEVLSPKSQMILLDRFGNYPELLDTVASTYRQWQDLVVEQKKWLLDKAQLDDIEQLNQTKIDLDALNLDALDFDALHQKQKQLQSRQTYLQACQRAMFCLDGDGTNTVCGQLHQAESELGEFQTLYPQSTEVIRLMQEALTNCQEAVATLQHSVDDDYSSDAETLGTIEQTLSECYTIARKYRQQPESLTTFQESVCQQIDHHAACDEKVAELTAAISEAETVFFTSARQLSTRRSAAAKNLSAVIQDQLPALNLSHGIFLAKTQEVAAANVHGIDRVTFLFTGNPGIPLAPLDQCASGGELARLALLIAASIPTDHTKVMIFDEADVGVSGKTASMIGQLFSQLAQQHQIICLTHSPQVTAHGRQHWHVEKQVSTERTTTAIRQLNHEAHIAEVARLLSGIDISEESLVSAKQLCAAAVTA